MSAPSLLLMSGVDQNESFACRRHFRRRHRSSGDVEAAAVLQSQMPNVIMRTMIFPSMMPGQIIILKKPISPALVALKQPSYRPSLIIAFD